MKGDETTWEPWVTQLITGYKIDQGGGIDGFLDVNAQGERQKIPSYGLDYAACWVNNPRDVINLQVKEEEEEDLQSSSLLFTIRSPPPEPNLLSEA